jgi:sugar O-acyltransferase (sialic acid O-acetyltransferase NeuD family)
MTEDNKIILLGAGGHSKVLIELIRASGLFDIAGILDPLYKTNKQLLGIPVLGDDDLLVNLKTKGIKNACISVGSVRDNTKRQLLFEKALQAGFAIPAMVHPSAFVSQSATIADGVQIMAKAVVQSSCVIKQNSIINSGAIVEHDCSIGRNVHICPGCVVSGGCTINDNAFIGAGATIINSIIIDRAAIIAAGAVVTKNVPAETTVKGVPAK